MNIDDLKNMAEKTVGKIEPVETATPVVCSSKIRKHHNTEVIVSNDKLQRRLVLKCNSAGTTIEGHKITPEDCTATGFRFKRKDGGYTRVHYTGIKNTELTELP